MASATLGDFKALSFDCYGTLIDWESGIWDALQPLLMTNGRTDITRDVGLSSFARFETERESAQPDLLYPDLLAQVHDDIAKHYGLTTTCALNDEFGGSVPHWPAFPDSADALRRLKKHYRLIILSNVNRDGFAASNRKLGVEFDAIYTAQDIGTYKPNPGNFEYLSRKVAGDFDLGDADLLHTAQSLHHDHLPAHRHGLTRAWIDRQRLSAGGDWGATAKIDADLPEPAFLYYTMGEMADAVEAAAA